MSPGRDVNEAPNPSNPRWKTISLPYLSVMIVNEYVEAHPESGYTGVADMFISMVRPHPDYRQAVAEYLVRHGLEYLDQDEVENRLAEAEAKRVEALGREAEAGAEVVEAEARIHELFTQLSNYAQVERRYLKILEGDPAYTRWRGENINK